MDPLQLLGSLLGSNPTASHNNNQILGQLIGSLTGGGTPAAGAPAATPVPGAPAAPAVGGAGIGGLLGGLALTALQGFMQRGAPGAQSPLGALAGMLGGGGAGSGGQSPLAALASALGFGNAAAATPAGVAAAANLTTQAQQQALVLIQAMINAAKADGQIDEQEKQQIVSRLAGVGPQEMEFVQQELTKPLNVDFLRNVDPAMATEVYTLSLMAINLDTQAEKEYMQYLAQQLGMNPQTVNNIHQHLGLGPLFV